MKIERKKLLTNICLFLITNCQAFYIYHRGNFFNFNLLLQSNSSHYNLEGRDTKIELFKHSVDYKDSNDSEKFPTEFFYSFKDKYGKSIEYKFIPLVDSNDPGVYLKDGKSGNIVKLQDKIVRLHSNFEDF